MLLSATRSFAHFAISRNVENILYIIILCLTPFPVLSLIKLAPLLHCPLLINALEFERHQLQIQVVFIRHYLGQR